MDDAESIKATVFNEISKLLEGERVEVTEQMPLIGGDSRLDSMKLVELCLALEDLATELGFEFDWTSDVAMSRSRSMFRTAGTLASEFLSQMGTTK